MDEIRAYDTVVSNYSLPKEICPNVSDHTKNVDGIPGEVMFLHDAMFLCRRIANMEMGYSSEDHMHWTFSDAKIFYEEHNFSGTRKFHDLLQVDSKKSIANWYFKGRSQTYLTFLAYRWDNGMVFDNYKGRVEKCIEKRKVEDLANIKNIIEAFAEKENQVAALNGQLDTIRSGISDPQLLHILEGINISVLDLMNNEDDD